MHLLLDAGSVSALLLALERAAIRIPWIPVHDTTAPRRNVSGYLRRYHAILHDQRNERLIMTDNIPSKIDPYAGARAMGITVPAAPDPQAEAEAPQRSGDDSADYAAYLAWRDTLKSTAPESGANVTVTPAAEAAETSAPAATAPQGTPIGAYLGADVTAAGETVEAVAPGLVTRLKTVLSDHQSLVAELEELIAEAEKF